MTGNLVVGIDLGTTYFKVGLFDRDGELHGLGRVAVETDDGLQGCGAELPVDRFERLVRTAWQAACLECGADPATLRVAGMAYSSQANSFLLLDGADRPLTPVIMWPDARAVRLEKTVDEYDRRSDRIGVTGIGLPLGPQFAINKLAWIRREQPDVWRRTRKVATLSDYLVLRLTGVWAGDLGTAGLLAIVNPVAGDWWDPALGDLRIERRRLPKLRPPGTLIGLTDGGARRFGFPAGIPMALGGLDHHMAALGAGVPVVAPVSVSLGTVLACMALTPDYLPRKGCCCGRGVTGQGFTRLAFSDFGGSVLEWFQRVHAPGVGMAELDKAAAAVAPGCDGLTALPDAAARPGLQGFEHAAALHTTGHYFRALMERTAHSLAGLLEFMGNPPKIVLAGGGARSAVWRDIVRQITGCRIITVACPEPACRGAAMLAATAAGW